MHNVRHSALFAGNTVFSLSIAFAFGESGGGGDDGGGCGAKFHGNYYYYY